MFGIIWALGNGVLLMAFKSNEKHIKRDSEERSVPLAFLSNWQFYRTHVNLVNLI